MRKLLATLLIGLFAIVGCGNDPFALECESFDIETGEASGCEEVVDEDA